VLFCSIAVLGGPAFAVQEKALATFQLQGLPTIDLSGLTWQNSLQQLNGFGFLNIGTDAKKIVFTLRTQKGNYKDEIIDVDDPASIANSTWDQKQKVKIVTHGYMEDATGGPLSLTKTVFNEYTNVRRPENLIFMDWSNLARQLNYYDSVANVPKAGQRLAQLLVTLRNSNLITDFHNVHITGLSLGAHVVAFASTISAQIVGEQIGRISGLDPAGPGFVGKPLDQRLDSSDAAFVDVMHTNAGRSINQFKYFGYPDSIGHVDFWPSGGSTQPQCTIPLLGEVIGVCSHSKAADYFASTILGRQYIGCPCANWSTYQKGACACSNGPIMGENVDQSARGNYYLNVKQ